MSFIYSIVRVFNLESGRTPYIVSNFSHIYMRRKLRYVFSNYLRSTNISNEILIRAVPLFNHSYTLQKECNLIKSSTSLSSFNFYIHDRHYSQTQDKTKDLTPGEDQQTSENANFQEPHSSSSSSREAKNDESEKNLSLVQKFKLIYKQYWYVLIPVHVATSIVWYGAFFFAAKSGFDIVPVLEKMGATEKFLAYLRNSNAGYYGIAYAMYKIATPARYTVTIGGTTISINYLKNKGYIKPVPTKEELKEMYVDKKEEFKERREEMRERYQEKKNEIMEMYQDKTDEMKEKYQEKKNEFLGKYSLSKSKSEKEKR